MRIFDLICYHTLINYIYDIDSKKTIYSIDLPKDISKYQKFMEEKFSKSFLNEEKKSQMVVDYIEKADVVFIQ